MRRMINVRSFIALTFVASGLALVAQDEKPSLFADDVVRAHEIKPHRRSIPVQGVQLGFNELRITLTISPTGSVMNAEAHGRSGSMKYWPSVEREIEQWHFAPFEKDGKPVTAIIDEYVDLVPPERFPTVHVVPPAIRPDSKIVITLERTGCFGTCPAYLVTLDSDGDVVFDGLYYVEAKGKQTSHVDPTAVRQLAQDFVTADFYSMDPVYRALVTDSPTYVLSISIDGKKKTVDDYVGPWVGMPSVVTDLEDKVDEVAQTKRWIGTGTKHE